MKKKIIGLISLATSSLLVLGFGINLYFQPTKEEVTASKSSYWDSWITSNSGKIATGGTTLMSALSTKISGGTTSIGYKGLWDAYKTSDSVPGSNGTKIWDMYGGFQFNYQSSGSSYSGEGDCYNREHSVPKSWFGSPEESAVAYSDLVHLVPTDGKVNQMRSNYAFGEVSSASYSYGFPARSYGGTQYQTAGVSKVGTPKTINGVSAGVSTVFEPDDQYKGDFARIYMYFATRYGGGTYSPTLEDSGRSIFTTAYTNSNPYFTDYGLALLRKWHVQDRVSQKEIDRNNAVETLQGNRNPFVDYPEWADKIFGTNYSGGDTPSVIISQTTASILVGGSVTLTATASDSSAITWSSSASSVASVSNGVVIGVSVGSATITASATIDSTVYSATCEVTVISSTPTSITASVSKAFYVGETISKSDITVKDNLNNVITNYSFSNYQFTYADGPSGGSSKNKSFTISYNNMTTTLNVAVSRQSYATPGASVTDTINRELTGVASGSTSYTSWSNKRSNSNAVYAGQSAGGNNSIQLRSANNNSGIVSTTSGGTLTKVEVTWNSNTGSRTLCIYGKTSAYSSATALYSTSPSTQGTSLGYIVHGNSTSLNITGNYTYIGIRSMSGALYLTEVKITYSSGSGSETAKNVSNYIMYEDTENQCTTKFTTASGYFNNLSTSEKSSFMTSSDYVISTARERFEAWAANRGKTITYSNGTYTIINASNRMSSLNNEKNTDLLVLLIGVMMCCSTFAVAIYMFKKSKEQ